MKKLFLAIAAIAAFSVNGFSTVPAVDTTAGAAAPNVNPQVITITIGSNSNRALYVLGRSSQSDGACPVESVDVGGSPATEVTHQGDATGGGTPYVGLWRLLNPGTGVKVVTITFNGANCSGALFRSGAISLYNVHQTTSEGTPVTAAVSSGCAPSLTPGSTTNDLVLDGITFEFDPLTLTIGSGQASQIDDGDYRLRGSSETGASGTTTMSWSCSGGVGDYVGGSHIAVAVKGTAVAGVPNGLLLMGVGQ